MTRTNVITPIYRLCANGANSANNKQPGNAQKSQAANATPYALPLAHLDAMAAASVRTQSIITLLRCYLMADHEGRETIPNSILDSVVWQVEENAAVIDAGLAATMKTRNLLKPGTSGKANTTTSNRRTLSLEHLDAMTAASERTKAIITLLRTYHMADHESRETIPNRILDSVVWQVEENALVIDAALASTTPPANKGKRALL